MDTEGGMGGRRAVALAAGGARAAGGALAGAVANRLAARRGYRVEGASSDVAFPVGLGESPGSPTVTQEASELETADEYFLECLAALGRTYRSVPIWTERDLVYVLQRQLVDDFRRSDAAWRVFNGHRVNPGESPSMSADLVIVAPSGQVRLGAEFKYEPCHRRPDIAKGKFPVAVWSDVLKDTVRAQLMVDRGAEVAYAICVDEGGWTKNRDRSMFEEHSTWDTDCPCGREHGVEVLIHRVSVHLEGSA